MPCSPPRPIHEALKGRVCLGDDASDGAGLPHPDVAPSPGIISPSAAGRPKPARFQRLQTREERRRLAWPMLRSRAASIPPPKPERVRRMDIVFPSSREERCPRSDCGSREVEQLETEFVRLRAKSSAQALFVCLTCQRPFKLVRESAAPPAPLRGRGGPAGSLER
jgi:hypothetical protein